MHHACRASCMPCIMHTMHHAGCAPCRPRITPPCIMQAVHRVGHASCRCNTRQLFTQDNAGCLVSTHPPRAHNHPPPPLASAPIAPAPTLNPTALSPLHRPLILPLYRPCYPCPYPGTRPACPSLALVLVSYPPASAYSGHVVRVQWAPPAWPDRPAQHGQPRPRTDPPSTMCH